MAFSYKKEFVTGAPIYEIHSLEDFDRAFPIVGLQMAPQRTEEEQKKAETAVALTTRLCKEAQKWKEREHALEVMLDKLGYGKFEIEAVRKQFKKKAQQHLDGIKVTDEEGVEHNIGKLFRQKTEAHDNGAQAKKTLIKVMYHATFPEGKSAPGIGNRAVANGLYIYDWDGIWDMTPRERLDLVVKKYAECGLDFWKEERILLAHVSPSGHGLRLVAKADADYNIADNQLRLAQRMGVPESEHDKCVHDLSRVSYAVPMTAEYVIYLDEELFTYNNEEYSKRWSTWKSDADDHKGDNNLPFPLRSADHYSGKIKEEVHEALAEEKKAEKKSDDKPTDELNYMGIPYSTIIQKWWEMYNGGSEPCVGDRDTRTYELALNLRNICAYDRNLLDKVIPCYDGFTQAEKMKCIDSALKYEITRMPKKLMDVLSSLRSTFADNKDVIDALEEMEENDELYYFNQINTKMLPMGIIDSLDGVRPTIAMPVFVAVGPMVGALATDVQLWVHDAYFFLNLTARIVGNSGSGKGNIDSLWSIWMADLINAHKETLKMEKAYKDLPAKEKEKTKRPKTSTRILSLRTSQAEVITRLDAVQGKHLISFSAELDQLAQNRGSSSMDTSAIERIAFDNKKWDSMFHGENAGNGYIDEVKWNTIACGTSDALYRSCKLALAGDIQRLAIARTPGDEFSRLVIVPPRKQKSVDNIRRVAELLPLMSGKVYLEKLENRCQEWVEKVRLETLRDDDRIRAALRIRPCISAMRYTCCFLLCAYAEMLIKRFERPHKSQPKWTDGCTSAEEYLKLHPERLEWHLSKLINEDWLKFFDTLATYLLDNLDYYFHSSIQTAGNNLTTNYGAVHRRAGKNRSLFSRLQTEFTFEDACAVKGADATRNSVHQMLKNWAKQGLIQSVGDMKYKKIKN